MENFMIFFFGGGGGLPLFLYRVKTRCRLRNVSGETSRFQYLTLTFCASVKGHLT